MRERSSPGVILTDDVTGVRAAVNHLVDCGYRGSPSSTAGARASSTIRADAVAATLAEPRDPDRPAHLPGLGRCLAGPGHVAAAIVADLPEALVCYDDKLALALMDALRRLRIRVPEDIGMVGFDGIPFAAISNPRLTTVATPSGEIGRLAATSLIRAIQGGSIPQGMLLQPELIVRESTRTRA